MRHDAMRRDFVASLRGETTRHGTGARGVHEEQEDEPARGAHVGCLRVLTAKKLRGEYEDDD